ncbi:MAG TPA: hypothetical protein VGB77_04860 [Abditibacteriaceae bacterium]|jgi:hypothetical protein
MKHFSKRHIAKANFSLVGIFGYDWQCFHTSARRLAEQTAADCRRKGIQVKVVPLYSTDALGWEPTVLYLVVARCASRRFRHIVRVQHNQIHKSRLAWQQQQKAVRDA